MNRLLLFVVLALNVCAQQNPPSPPVHEPKACTRPENPRKGYVPCAKCKLVCDEHGRRVEDNTCSAWCKIDLCHCMPPCCPD